MVLPVRCILTRVHSRGVLYRRGDVPDSRQPRAFGNDASRHGPHARAICKSRSAEQTRVLQGRDQQTQLASKEGFTPKPEGCTRHSKPRGACTVFPILRDIIISLTLHIGDYPSRRLHQPAILRSRRETIGLRSCGTHHRARRSATPVFQSPYTNGRISIDCSPALHYCVFAVSLLSSLFDRPSFIAFCPPIIAYKPNQTNSAS